MSEPISISTAAKAKADLPLTMEEAGPALFDMTYQSLKNRLQTLIADGCPVVREGRRYLFYPSHVRAWRASRYTAEARRALRQGDLDVQTQAQR